MNSPEIIDRVLKAIAGEASPTFADARALADGLQAVLAKGTPHQVTDALARLVQAGVIVIQGDVNVAQGDGILVTRSSVQLTLEQQVILTALRSLSHRIAEDEAARTRICIAQYLSAVRDYCAGLPYLTLHGIRPPRRLDEVYVPLKARPQPRTQEGDSKRKRDVSSLGRSRRMSIAEVMQSLKHRQVVILGEPGAGKSTLLRQMAEHAWNSPEKIGLDAPHLPILVSLRRLCAGGSLETRLAQALSSELPLCHDLPQGFFSDWPVHAETRWLILLDGLDEAPVIHRVRLVQWLKGVLKALGEHRVVITSRPSGYVSDDFDTEQFAVYDLLPFGPQQTDEFVRKWFGDKGCHFLAELANLRTGDLHGTPLLLTIAAKVFLEKGELPIRRSTLYGEFVDIWLAEAEQQGLRAELDERICKVARFALAKLAMTMTVEQGIAYRPQLCGAAAEYLRNALHLSYDEAETDGEKFVEVMSRRSGVFTHRGSHYDFLHPTFREYLTALIIVRDCEQDLESVWAEAVSRWGEHTWREIALFSLGVLSDRGVDVTRLIEQIIDDDPQTADSEENLWAAFERLSFACVAISERVKVDLALKDRLADRLLQLMREADPNLSGFMYGLVEPESSSDPIGALGLLEGSVRAKEALRVIANNQAYGYTAFLAMRSLARLGLSDADVGLLTAWGLGDVHFDDHADSEEARILWQTDVAELLRDLGYHREAVTALIAVFEDEYSPEVRALVLEDILEVSDDLDSSEDVTRFAMELAQRDYIELEVQRTLAETLARGHLAQEAVSVLAALAANRYADEWARCDAAMAIGSLGHVEQSRILLSQMSREFDDSYVRAYVERALREA